MILPVDTAVVVPVSISALIDDTDFKTREESVTFNQAGLDLVWNFLTFAGVLTQTAVTPTDTGGNYDWTNKGNGMYGIEIPASGGASINNDTEGQGWFTGFATGILPWVGPVIQFVAQQAIDGFTAATPPPVILSGSAGIKKNTAKAAFMFAMTDASTHTPAPGLTVTATRSLDGAAFGACANAVVEVASGWYKIDLAASDLNGDTVALKFTATGADATNISIVTGP